MDDKQLDGLMVGCKVRQMDWQSDRWTFRWTVGWTDGWMDIMMVTRTDSQMDSCMNGWRHRQSDGETDRRSDGWMNWPSDGQTGRQSLGQIDLVRQLVPSALVHFTSSPVYMPYLMACPQMTSYYWVRTVLTKTNLHFFRQTFPSKNLQHVFAKKEDLPEFTFAPVEQVCL